MQCTNCGAAVAEDSLYCYSCGGKLAEPAAIAAPLPPPEIAGVASQPAPLPTPAPPAILVAPPNQPQATAPLPASSSAYGGAHLVFRFLWFLGWGTVVLSPIVGLVIGASLASDCRDSWVSECSQGDKTGIFIGTFIGCVIVGWLVALGVLWLAYVLRLLSDVEGHLRRVRAIDIGH